MASLIEVKNLVKRANTLSVNLGVTNYNTPFATKTSPEFVISGAAVFQVKVIAAQVNNGHTNIYNNLICVKFFKLRPDDDLTYTIKFTSKELGITNKCFTSDDGTWHLVHENKKQQYTFDVSVHMDIVPSASSFASLHDDNELTDFELRGEDGSVHVHRAVLAASSPVLRRMLGGTWRETTEGSVDVSGTSRLTLQHLKDYVYLHTLPENGLEQVLLLASYYMMPDLEQKCVDQLVSGLTAQNACDLLEFAAKHKVTRLLLAILECIQSGVVNVNDMRGHYLQSG
ncbi:speckle-type POZ protein-like [Epargyreus clarus]|uniref:speckle-type POZ protein-like n=1 Tax=Epargyreus clarus TaxID=520877 RepID=UPI003C2EFB2E